MLALFATACASSATPAYKLTDLVADLESQGLVVTVQPSPYAHQDVPTVRGQLACLNNREAIVFVYRDAASRIDEASNTPPATSSEIDLLWGSMGWWARGEVLVQYHHDPFRDDPIVDALTDILGSSIGSTGFALGDPPAELPFSGNCITP